LRQHPAVIKALMGVPAAAFWELLENIKAHLPAYAAQRLGRANRQRALGGGAMSINRWCSRWRWS
jgi:hypothetical protein